MDSNTKYRAKFALPGMGSQNFIVPMSGLSYGYRSDDGTIHYEWSKSFVENNPEIFEKIITAPIPPSIMHEKIKVSLIAFKNEAYQDWQHYTFNVSKKLSESQLKNVKQAIEIALNNDAVRGSGIVGVGLFNEEQYNYVKSVNDPDLRSHLLHQVRLRDNAIIDRISFEKQLNETKIKHRTEVDAIRKDVEYWKKEFYAASDRLHKLVDQYHIKQPSNDVLQYTNDTPCLISFNEIIKATGGRIKNYDQEELKKVISEKLKECQFLQKPKDNGNVLIDFDQLKNGLNIIANWELPATGKFWDAEKTKPLSYEAEKGSNGVRDFMKRIAQDLLSLIPAAKTTDENDKLGWRVMSVKNTHTGIIDKIFGFGVMPEVLKYTSKTWLIESVQRLSDNRLLTVGDITNQGRITGFEILGFNRMHVYTIHETIGGLTEINKISFLDSKPEQTGIPPATNKPVYFIDTGRAIQENDKYWSVDELLHLSDVMFYHNTGHYPTNIKRFSKKEAAEHYIIWSQKSLSLAELLTNSERTTMSDIGQWYIFELGKLQEYIKKNLEIKKQ